MSYPIYILAGGHSSRMGQDKGLLNINGKEMIKHCIENLKLNDQELKIITSNQAYSKFGFPLLQDTISNIGPAQGIITALSDCKSEACFIISCDMPLIDHSIVQQLSDEISSHEIALYADDYFYPFPGLYKKNILPKWKEAVEKGNNKLQSLIKLFNHKILPIEQPELFLNVNTPDDIPAVEQKLK